MVNMKWDHLCRMQNFLFITYCTCEPFCKLCLADNVFMIVLSFIFLSAFVFYGALCLMLGLCLQSSLLYFNNAFFPWCQIHADETKSSLQFASRALRVTNCVHVNEVGYLTAFCTQWYLFIISNNFHMESMKCMPNSCTRKQVDHSAFFMPLTHVCC